MEAIYSSGTLVDFFAGLHSVIFQKTELFPARIFSLKAGNSRIQHRNAGTQTQLQCP
jgi:hypothetical protein